MAQPDGKRGAAVDEIAGGADVLHLVHGEAALLHEIARQPASMKYHM